VELYLTPPIRLSCVVLENKSRKAFYYLFKNVLSFQLLFNKVKIKIYRTIIFPVLYLCEIFSLAVWENRR